MRSAMANELPIYYETDWDLPEPWPWARPIILSLDGGGVRGYASLLILEKLMEKIKAAERHLNNNTHTSSAAYSWCTNSTLRDEGFRPHHYLDYIFGTSTGGLSAIMLGRLYMTVSDAKQPYDRVGESVFAKPQHFTGDGYLRTKYSSRALEETLIAVTVEHSPDNETTANLNDQQRASYLHLANSEMKTRTVVIAYSAREQFEKIEGNPLLYRSYNRNPGTIPNCQTFKASALPLYKVALATCAAPRFFSAVDIGDTKVRDGALAKANNPVQLAYGEVGSMHSDPPSIILSIGTGQKKEKEVSRFLKKIGKLGNMEIWLKYYQDFKEAIRNSHKLHLGFEKTIEKRNIAATRRGEPSISYFRFDVKTGLERVRLGEWRGKNGSGTKDIIRNAVDKYVEDKDVDRRLDECADLLVKIRRSRQRTARWEEFAIHVRYQCPEKNEDSMAEICEKKFSTGTRSQLKEHLKLVHGITYEGPVFSGSEGQELSNIDCRLPGHKDRRPILFDSDSEYLEHLQKVHGMSGARRVSWEELEKMLDKAREESDHRELTY